MTQISKTNVHDEHGFYYGISDVIFKRGLFGEDEDISKWFTSKLLGMNVKRLEHIDSFIPSHKKNEKTDELDVLLEINDTILCNIEVDTNYRNSTSEKNFGYLANMYVKSRKSYEYFIQFDIVRGTKVNASDVIKRKVYYHSDDFRINVQKIVTYVIYVDKILELLYNDDEQGIRKYAHIMMLALGKKDLDKLANSENLSKTDKFYIRQFERTVVLMNKKKGIVRWMTREEERDFMHKIDLEEAKEEGRDEGHTEGLVQGHTEGLILGEQIGAEKKQNEMVSNMLSLGINPDIINKIVNVSTEKIKEMKSSVQIM